MARPSNASLLKRQRSQIELSRQWRQTEDYDELWRRMIDLYRGRHYKSMLPEDKMLVNMAFSTINIVVPSVSVRNPTFTVNAQTPDSAPNAIVTEAVLNYIYRTNKFHRHFKRAVKDSRIIGHGWLKVGYKFVKEGGKPEVTISEGEDGEAHVDGQYEVDEQVPENVVGDSDAVVKEDRPFVEHVSVFNVFVDPDATSMDDLGWIAQRIRRPIAEVAKDKRYKASVRKTLVADAQSRWSEPRTTRSGPDEIRDTTQGYVDIWEFYDVRKCVVSVFANTGDDFLIAPRRMPYSTGHPFVRVSAYEIPEFFYPMGDLEAVEILQLELNETRSQMMNHRKKFSRKYLYREADFSPDGVEALKSPDDNVMVPVESDRTLADVVQALPAQITPPEFYNQSATIQGDIDRVSGVSDYQRGGMPDVRRTATEAGIMADAANARAADAVSGIEECLADIGYRIIKLMQQFMTSDQVARVTGPSGMPVWIQFDADYIQGEFDYEVVAGSTQPNNESFRRQSALQLMDSMAPLMPFINGPELARHVLAEGFGIKDTDRFIAQPMAPPMGQEQTPGGPGTGMPPQMGMPPQTPEMGMPSDQPVSAEIPPELLAMLMAQQQGM